MREMKLDKFTQATLIIICWGLSALLMSLLYSYLQKVGFIYDNPDMIRLPNGQWRHINESWNSRKVIFGLLGGSSFILAAIKIGILINEAVNK